MPATKQSPVISAPLANAVPTGADTGSPVTRKADPAAREKWQEIIDYILIEWGCDPGQFEDEGIEPPSRRTIQLAINVARSLREAGLAPPIRVVPDAHGGIVFERQEKEVFETFRISADGSLESCLFQNTRLVHRQSWVLKSLDGK